MLQASPTEEHAAGMEMEQQFRGSGSLALAQPGRCAGWTRVSANAGSTGMGPSGLSFSDFVG
jgi:hypothetical protein